MHKKFKKRWKRIADKMTEQEISEYYEHSFKYTPGDIHKNL